MSVHLYLINVKTAEPIGPKICDAMVTKRKCFPKESKFKVKIEEVQ